jgi:nucleoside-diphosphate-sugar epimerase
MKIFLTGGAGDLGTMLCNSLRGMGHTPVVFDVAPGRAQVIETHSQNDSLDVPADIYIEGSILDRAALKEGMRGCDMVVHIAAWHGIHEHRGDKTEYEFWDLNVGGTFNVFQAAVETGIKDIIFISSTSIDEKYGIYGHTKVLGEEIAEAYAHRHDMNVIVLRPRAFIPPWNRSVYDSFVEWAKWFAQGAVHISDVAQAVIKSIELLASKKHELHNAPVFLTIDSAYQYSDDDLANWDKEGPGTTFDKHYKQFHEMAVKFGLQPELKPKKLDITRTQEVIDYKPLYSMKTLLLELKMYGAEGPYADRK